MEKTKVIRRMSRVGVWGNVALAAFKLVAGLIGRSGAMVSDAVHSATDILATAIAWLGARLAGRRSDERHPYGHERIESVASLALGLLLAAAGLGIGWEGLSRLLSGDPGPAPGLLPLIAAVVSIAIKEGMYRYTMKMAKKIQSSVFLADAQHHRSDALSSVGALLGIAGARLGLTLMEPLAQVVICLFILRTAWEVLREAVDGLLDTAWDSASERGLRDFIADQPGVLGVDALMTRRFGNLVYVDAEIAVDGSLTLTDAHAIAEAVHQSVEQRFPSVKHILIHVNPMNPAS